VRDHSSPHHEAQHLESMPWPVFARPQVTKKFSFSFISGSGRTTTPANWATPGFVTSLFVHLFEGLSSLFSVNSCVRLIVREVKPGPGLAVS